MRALLDREIIVRLRTDDEGGDLVSPDDVPTLVALDGNGDEIEDVEVDEETESPGVWRAVVPAQSSYDRLSLVWTALVADHERTVTDHVDLISERLVPLWRLREDAELANLSTLSILRLADGVEEWMRSALKFPAVPESSRVSWVSRYVSDRIRIPGVHFPISLLALARGRGTSTYNFSPTDLEALYVVDDGFENNGSNQSFLTGVPTQGSQFAGGPWSAHVVHGMIDTPEDLRKAASALARYTARTTNYPERARKIITAETEIDFSFPSPDRPTGLPDVDAAIGRYRIQAL